MAVLSLRILTRGPEDKVVLLPALLGFALEVERPLHGRHGVSRDGGQRAGAAALAEELVQDHVARVLVLLARPPWHSKQTTLL